MNLSLPPLSSPHRTPSSPPHSSVRFSSLTSNTIREGIYCTIVFHPEGFNGVAKCAKPRRVTVSKAKKAVDSTLRRIFNYTAEIIISLILLVTICIPLAFTIPMWFEHVFFNVPRTELAINPANWWGLDGTLWVTLFLGLVSLTIGYLYIIKMNPGVTSDDDHETEDKDDDDEEEEASDAESEEASTEVVDEAVADDVPLEDQEADEDIPLEDQEEEDEPDLDEIEKAVEEASEED